MNRLEEVENQSSFQIAAKMDEIDQIWCLTEQLKHRLWKDRKLMNNLI